MRDFYERFYSLAPSSAAHGEFCRRAFGLDMCQHGFADVAQIEALIEATRLGPGQRALDLGCGTGRITELLAARTAAHLTGLDLIPEAIRLARELPGAATGQLAFLTADLNDLHLPRAQFDVILSIDSIYFSRDYSRTIGDLSSALQPGGRMGFLYTHGWEPSMPIEDFDRAELAPASTPLARALVARGLALQFQDWTAADCRNACIRGEILAELSHRLHAEGLGFVLDNRLGEIAGIRQACGLKLHRRWLFVAS